MHAATRKTARTTREAQEGNNLAVKLGRARRRDASMSHCLVSSKARTKHWTSLGAKQKTCYTIVWLHRRGCCARGAEQSGLSVVARAASLVAKRGVVRRSPKRCRLRVERWSQQAKSCCSSGPKPRL
jgi:hypothetical protein